jgi:cytochrome P450
MSERLHATPRPDAAIASFDHLRPEFHTRRLDEWATLRETCPVAWNPNYGGFWAVASYEEVCTVARDSQVYSSAYEPGAADGIDYLGISGVPRKVGIPRAGIAEVEGPDHEAIARLMNRCLRPRVAQERAELMQSAARWFLDQKIETGGIDLVDDYASPVTSVLTMALIGLPISDWEPYAELFHATIACRPSNPRYQQAIARVPEMLERLRSEADRCRANPRDDLLSALVQLELDGKPLDDEAITSVLWNLVGGGLDTTASLTSLTLLHLAAHPDQRRRLIEQPSLLPGATEEFLRYFTVNEQLSRTVSVDTELGGQRLRAGDRLLISWLSANRDATQFPDPDEVILDRSPNPHVAFGVGPHRCLGMHVARTSFQVLIREVLERIPDYQVSEPPEFYDGNPLLNGLVKLPVTFTPGPRLGPDKPPFVLEIDDDH